MNFISTGNCSLHQAMANQLLSNLCSHTRISKDLLVNILPNQKFVSVDEAEITHFFIGLVFLGQPQCASHNVLPSCGIRRGNDFCVISQAGGQLLNFKSQGGDTFRGEDDFRQSSRGDCFIMTNCWYFHKMLHLEFYKFRLWRYLMFF